MISFMFLLLIFTFHRLSIHHQRFFRELSNRLNEVNVQPRKQNEKKEENKLEIPVSSKQIENKQSEVKSEPEYAKPPQNSTKDKHIIKLDNANQLPKIITAAKKQEDTKEETKSRPKITTHKNISKSSSLNQTTTKQMNSTKSSKKKKIQKPKQQSLLDKNITLNSEDANTSQVNTTDEPQCFKECHEFASCIDHKCVCNEGFYGDGLACLQHIPNITAIYPSRGRKGTQLYLTLSHSVDFETKGYVSLGNLIVKAKSVVGHIAIVTVPKLAKGKHNLAFSLDGKNWSAETVEFVYAKSNLSAIGKFLRLRFFILLLGIVSIGVGIYAAGYRSQHVVNKTEEKQKEETKKIEEFFEYDVYNMASDFEDLDDTGLVSKYTNFSFFRKKSHSKYN